MTAPLPIAALLPNHPGTYVLFLYLGRDTEVTIGRLGSFCFLAGFYAYVGSARAAGGLTSRVARHLRSSKPLHWHIDYLRPGTRPFRVWWAEGAKRRECAWAAALARMDGAVPPVRGFGSSDCRCPSHLIHFPALPGREAFERAVGERVKELELNE